MSPRDYAADTVLRDGTAIHVRAIRPDDKQGLVEMFERLSPQTVYYRFHGAKRRLTREELIYLTELDFHRNAAIVATLQIGDAEHIVGVARYATAPGEAATRAEVALTVEDAHQSRGIGPLLFEHLTRIANSEGIREFDAFVLADNDRMIRLFERSGRVLARKAERGACHLILSTAL